MMKFIRLDADIDHHGKMVTGSTTMSYDGRLVARKGDHGPYPRQPKAELATTPGSQHRLSIEQREKTANGPSWPGPVSCLPSML